MEKRRELWHRIINSRALAGVGVVALLLAGGFGITRVASAQTTSYLIPASTLSLMQQQIQDLTNRVTSLETQVRILQNERSATTRPISGNPVVTANPTYTYTYPTPAPAPAPAPTPAFTYPTAPSLPATQNAVVIDQNGGTYVAGFDIYITGRGFMPNETVLITRSGVVVGHATVDAGGSFSTSGILLPLGPNTFTLTGQTSGISAVATVNGVTSVI